MSDGGKGEFEPGGGPADSDGYRLSELADASGVPAATVKYYLREGLLPPGRAVTPRLAEYSAEHLRRLRLIRALIGVRGLSVDATRDVLRALDAHPDDPHLAIGLAVGSVDPRGLDDGCEPEPPGAHSVARDLAARLGWRVHPESTPLDRLDGVVAAFAELYPDEDAAEWLRPYARLMEDVATLDLDTVDDSPDPGRRVERAVIGTFLLDSALRELRRLAQENESARRLDVGGPARGEQGTAGQG